MRYLFDTNHLSPLVTLSHPLRQRILRASTVDSNQFYVIPPILTEFLFGIRLLRRAKQNEIEWQKLRLGFTVLPIDESDADMAARLQVQLRKRGWQLKTVDALIAAISLRYDLVLLTTDRDFSPIPHLKTENWLLNR